MLSMTNLSLLMFSVCPELAQPILVYVCQCAVLRLGIWGVIDVWNAEELRPWKCCWGLEHVLSYLV